MEPNISDLSFKVILIGDIGVGKSSIILYFVRKQFTANTGLTVGIEFTTKRIKLNDKTTITMQIWDTAGQEAFKSLVKSFYKNASAVIFVYDITRKDTLDRLEQWVSEVKQNVDKSTIFLLIGNKNDEDSTEVEELDGSVYSYSNNFHCFYETSAKLGHNIDKVFKDTATLIYENCKNNKFFRETFLFERSFGFKKSISLHESKPDSTLVKKSLTKRCCSE